jgi:hypothetical protein
MTQLPMTKSFDQADRDIYRLINSGDSLDPVQDLRLTGYFRSLARRMYREVTAMAKRNEPCRN